MELDDDKLKVEIEEPHHLSGAYIRSLVKQLTTSRTTKHNPNSNLNNNMDKFSHESQQQQHGNHPPQPPQHKKQVRRRLHTSRPYQERLLNMAEARREIVTALKFHRASMKQQQQANQQQQQPHQQQEQPQPTQTKSRKIYPSNTSNYPENLPFSSHEFQYQYQYQHQNDPFVPIAPQFVSENYENFDLILPNQTLGLNLNFQDFTDINTTLYHNDNSPPFYSTSASAGGGSASSPSSSSSAIATAEQGTPVSAATVSQKEVKAAPAAAAAAEASDSGGSSGGGLHAAMDDAEMAEIRSIGEQHQMEWNDTMNLVTSAWWFKFLKTMELGGGPDDFEGCHHPFEEVMEFPAWLNANETCLNDFYSDEHFQDHALPCMDIGEIESIDGDWWLA